MQLDVVIPTYNRGPKLSVTLEALLQSQTVGLDEVRIVVVDDGSPIPASPIVESRLVAPPFALRCIRQANAGPAAARNTGFRASLADIVLFMDDDILASPALLRQHVEAHRLRPSSVVFGSCPLMRTPKPNSLLEYLEEDTSPSKNGTVNVEFIPHPIIASGQLSVERPQFDPEQRVYSDGLATPAAEEFELSIRLKHRGIPILQAPHIVAWHDHPITLDSVCGQQYKHGVGCAEAALKCPETLELPDLRRVIDTCGPASRSDSNRQVIKKAIKRLASMQPSRKALLRLAQASEKLMPRSPALHGLYRTAISAHFCAGVRDGLKKFAQEGAKPLCPSQPARILQE